MTPFRKALNDERCDLVAMARDLGVHRGTVWRWRSGKSIPLQPLAGQVLVWLSSHGFTVDFNGLYQAPADCSLAQAQGACRDEN